MTLDFHDVMYLLMCVVGLVFHTWGIIKFFLNRIDKIYSTLARETKDMHHKLESIKASCVTREMLNDTMSSIKEINKNTSEKVDHVTQRVDQIFTLLTKRHQDN